MGTGAGPDEGASAGWGQWAGRLAGVRGALSWWLGWAVGAWGGVEVCSEVRFPVVLVLVLGWQGARLAGGGVAGRRRARRGPAWVVGEKVRGLFPWRRVPGPVKVNRLVSENAGAGASGCGLAQMSRPPGGGRRVAGWQGAVWWFTPRVRKRRARR